MKKAFFGLVLVVIVGELLRRTFAQTAVQKWTEVRIVNKRDRLIEIIKNAPRNTRAFNDQYADYLLENDVEPVVRCKDCGIKGAAFCMAGDIPLTETTGEMFCSLGERKKEG